MKPKYLICVCSLLGLLSTTAEAAAQTSSPAVRSLYAVSETPANRGSISVYDIEAGHRLIKTIKAVPNVADVRGVAASAVTGRIYVAYRDVSGIGIIYCLNVYDDTIAWNRSVSPDVDRLAVNPNGQLLFVPTWEGGSADFINVLNANTGDIVRQVHFSNRSHDTQYPLSGPIFQETKADDGSGRYLYLIDPSSYTVSRVGPYSGILGPYAVDSTSSYVVNNVRDLWGMQVANLRAGQIITADISDHQQGDAGLLHGIGWTPDQTEVWQNSSWSDPHVYVWDMRVPMAPVLKGRLNFSLTEALDTTTAQGRLVFHMFGALAEFERSLIRERTQAGLAAARRAGRTGGRPPKLTEDDIEAAKAMLANPDIGVTQIAHRLGVSPATLYRYIPAARTANTPGA
jgi:Helix-turn-helix domain of resolvase/Resolvase, N terminal domain